MVFGFGIIGLQVMGIWKGFQKQDSVNFLVAHSSKTSILLHQDGRRLFPFAKDSSTAEKVARTFKVGEHLESIQNETLGNTFQIYSENIYRVDSFAIFPVQIK